MGYYQHFHLQQWSKDLQSKVTGLRNTVNPRSFLWSINAFCWTLQEHELICTHKHIKNHLDIHFYHFKISAYVYVSELCVHASPDACKSQRCLIDPLSWSACDGQHPVCAPNSSGPLQRLYESLNLVTSIKSLKLFLENYFIL